ncbi:hypothetical protein [Terrimonas alba]
METIDNKPTKLKKLVGIILQICKIIAGLASAIKAIQSLFF